MQNNACFMVYFITRHLCDIKRSFSKYKNIILRSNRRSFSFKNLIHHVIILCNTFEYK